MTTIAAAERCQVAILALHYRDCAAALPPLRAALDGKVVIDATNPLAENWSPMPVPDAPSAAESIQALLPRARVVKAFNTVFADVMTEERLLRGPHRATSFVAGDDPAAVQTTMQLAQDAGFAPVAVGPLSLSAHLEAMAHLNIAIAVEQGGGTNAAFIYHQAA